MSEESADELSQESFLHMFKIKHEDHLVTVIANYPIAGQHCDDVNLEHVEIELNIMKYVNYNSVTVEISKRCQSALVLIPFLQERHNSFYNELAGRAKQCKRENITTDQLFWSSTCYSKFW